MKNKSFQLGNHNIGVSADDRINNTVKPFLSQDGESELSDFEKSKQLELKKIAKASERLVQIKQEEALAEIERVEKLRAEKSEYLANYQHYTSKADEQTDPKEEQKFRKWAANELTLANAIEVDVEETILQEDLPKTSFSEKVFKWLFSHSGFWIFQILVLFGAAIYSYDKVMTQNAEIQKVNAYLESAGRLTEMIAPPLDKSDIQQIWFDKYRLIGDMGFALFMLLVLAPHILLTLLPFVQLPKKLWVTYQSIPEVQKQWLSFAWSALVLFVVIMSHPHK